MLLLLEKQRLRCSSLLCYVMHAAFKRAAAAVSLSVAQHSKGRVAFGGASWWACCTLALNAALVSCALCFGRTVFLSAAWGAAEGTGTSSIPACMQHIVPCCFHLDHLGSTLHTHVRDVDGAIHHAAGLCLMRQWQPLGHHALHCRQPACLQRIPTIAGDLALKCWTTG